MPPPRHLTTAVLLLALASVSRAQDATKVVSQYLKAEGGKTLAKVQSISLQGSLTAASDGKTGAYTFDVKSPNRFYSELVVGDKNFIEAYNGKSAWHQTSDGQLATTLGAEGAQLEAAGQYYNNGLLLAKKNKLGLAFIGSSEVHGRSTQEIEITTPAGLKRRVFFDAQTHLIAKESSTVDGIDEQIFYDDYRTVDNIKIPYKIELHRGNDIYNVAVTRAVVNGTLGERVFDFPKKSQVQLPDLQSLFKEIDEHQKIIDKIKENYAGTRDEEETEYDKTGKVTKTDRKQYTFFYLNGREVSTLVKKDGQPLNDREQQKENEKTQKEIENFQKEDAKKEAKQEKAEEQGKEAKKDDDDVGIETFLRACQFVNPRRERFRGQDVLVFDFEPNPEFKPHKLGERIVHELAGVVWVDEKAHDVARLEAYFVGDFKIGGGVLANLQKGTSFIFEQAYLNNEVWLPTYEEAHVGVRLLLVKGFKVNAVTRYSEYKKFNVESIATIGKPKGSETTPATPPPTPESPPKPN